MKTSSILAAALVCALAITTSHAQTADAGKPANFTEQLVYSRAVEAVIRA